MLLLGARVAVEALRRVHLSPRQLAGPQRGIGDDVVLLLARVAREHLGTMVGARVAREHLGRGEGLGARG